MNEMESGWKTALRIEERLVDMCCVVDGTEQVIVVIVAENQEMPAPGTSVPKIAAYDLQSKSFLWSVQGTLAGIEKKIKPCGITADETGTLFVCDEENDAIHMFSADGDYTGCLLKKGDSGVESPRLIKWCKEKSCLVIYHRNETQHFVSVLQVNV